MVKMGILELTPEEFAELLNSGERDVVFTQESDFTDGTAPDYVLAKMFTEVWVVVKPEESKDE